MAPTAPANLRPNARLTDFGIAHAQTHDMQALLAPGIVPVTKKSDEYTIWEKGDLLRDDMEPRAAGTEANLIERRASSDTYNCIRYAAKEKLTDEDIDKYPGGLPEAEAAISRNLVEKTYIRIASQFSSALMTATPWTGIAAQTGIATGMPTATQFLRWDVSGSVPIQTLRRGIRSVHTSIGRSDGLALITGPKVFDDLVDHSTMLDRIQQSERGILNQDLMASVLGIEKVLPIRATRNTAAEGATTSMAQIVGQVALLAYFSKTPSLNEPAAAKIFTFDKYGVFPRGANGSQIPTPAIKKWFNADRGCWFYEAEIYFDIKVTAADAGLFFDAVVSA